MKNANIVANLRTILAELYPDVLSMQRLMADADLNSSRITLNSSALNNWHAIWSEAENINKVDAVLNIVLGEYRENPKFREAYKAYYLAKESVDSSPEPNIQIALSYWWIIKATHWSRAVFCLLLLIAMATLMSAAIHATIPTQLASRISTPTIGNSTKIAPFTSPYRILIDDQHSNDQTFDKFNAIHIENFIFEKSDTSEFTGETLSQYDGVIIVYDGFPQSKLFSENNIKAIQDYMNQGGRLFLVGIGWVWTQYSQQSIQDYPLNRIAGQYGILFNKDSVCKENKKELVEIGSELMDVQHPITKNLRIIASGSGAIVGSLQVISPAHAIISCKKPTPILAVNQIGKAKIAVLVHEDFIWKNLDSQQYDNYELLRNILAWLVAT